jgi:alkyl hydroperoxide reductase subunit F
MLNKDILDAVAGYAASMTRNVSLVLQRGEHEKRGELEAFLAAVAGVSERIRHEERETHGKLRSPLSFLLEADGEDTGIRFSGIPGGHEFNSFVLALLHAGGVATKLDWGLQQLIARIDEDLSFEVIVSLSCHNCPDVVQSLNDFALLNPRIESEMIDGGLFPDLIAEREIQGVPSVYLNGELFANGKVDAAQLIERLIECYPEIARTESAEALPVQDVTVIGGGPAGVSAAIYSARKGLAVTLVADRIGGQLKDTLAIENLISVPQTTGPKVVGGLVEHMSDYPITQKEHVKVDAIEQSGDTKILRLSSGEVIRTRALIIATGARWRELGVPGEREYIGNGVAYCPHCDGPFFKGKDVAVIGGGNSGIEAALDLAGIVRSVAVLEFAPELKADRVLVDQARRRDNIEILTNAATREVVAADGKVTGLRYVDRVTGTGRKLDLSAVFVQIGLEPNSQFAAGVLDLSEHGEIVVDDKCRTSAPGIFACGDVTTVPYKQIVVAMGEGSKAALAAFEYLLAASASGAVDEAA